MTISVVIPAYNEEDNIEQAVKDVHNFFPLAEIIVVDDCSTDATWNILQKVRVKIQQLKIYRNNTNLGHGQTVFTAFHLATQDYILYIDADRQISLSNVQIYPGVDILSGIRYNRKDKLFRKFITRILRLVILSEHGFYIRDSNCPFKVYKRSSLLPLLDKLPQSYIIPIACLEVLARRNKLVCAEKLVVHNEYDGKRVGFLQTINRRSIVFCLKAYWEMQWL